MKETKQCMLWKELFEGYRFKFIILFAFLFICFHRFVEAFFIKYLVPLFLYFDDNTLTKILFGGLFIYWFIRLLRQVYGGVVISLVNSFLGLLLILLCLYYRYYYIVPGSYEYADWCFGYKYVDFLFLLGIEPLLVKSSFGFTKVLDKLISKLKRVDVLKETMQTEKKGFYTDDPIRSSEKDTFFRLKEVNTLVDKIYNTEAKGRAFSVGIVSPWGYGKTSFLNLMEEKLEKKDVLIIHFNPWQYDKSISLIETFLKQMADKIRPYSRDVACDLAKYAKLLTGTGMWPLQLISNFLYQDASLLFKRIGGNIQQINRKIFVFIDDLDRMDGEEILEMLKVIRNSASFPNVYFVTAYDREYLNHTLTKNGLFNSSSFLEKIFQVEYSLPPIPKKILKKALLDDCRPFFDEKDYEALERELNSAKYSANNSFGFHFFLLKNMRDVHRYTNRFIKSYSSLKGNIVIKHLMTVTLLQLKYLSIYELFSNRKSQFLVTDEKSKVVRLYTKEDAENEGTNTASKLSKYSETPYWLFEDYLSKNRTKLGIDEMDIEDIMLLIKELFRGSSSGHSEYGGINHAASIERYFQYSLLDTDLKVETFNELWEKHDDDLKPQIEAIIESHQLNSLVSQLKDKVPVYIIDEENLKRFIKIMFYIVEKEGQSEYYDDIVDRLTMYYRYLRENSKKSDGVSPFLYDLLEAQTWNRFLAVFFSFYIGGLLKRKEEDGNEGSNMLTEGISKIEKIEKDFFDKYIELNPPIEELWDYVPNFSPFDIKSGNKYAMDSHFQEKLKDYVNHNLDNFLSYINKLNQERSMSLFSDTVKEIWGGDLKSWDGFEKYVKSLSDSPKVREFKDFWEEFKKSGYPEIGIEYNFKNITPK